MHSDREDCPKVLAVIPARFSSTRFPGKVIAPLEGKPLVAHTYARTIAAERVHRACIATDDARVTEALAPYNIPTVMTRADHPSGTDRIAEVAADSDADIIVNVQGDEPLIAPSTIDKTIGALFGDQEAVMATARRRITNPELIQNPNVVKVVTDARGRALYFSRCPIPFVRKDGYEPPAANEAHWQHIGLYAFRKAFLLEYAAMEPSFLERLERLEQLRALENGHAIAVADTEFASIGVDTPGDLERVNAFIARYGKDALEHA